MLTIENTDVVGWEHAIRGMRNPLNSWAKSDSYYSSCDEQHLGDKSAIDRLGFYYIVGENDLNLMKRLRDSGTDHRKFMRMITVYVDITGPLYWWKEFDTYKVGTVSDSCSTMHKIHSKEITIEDFTFDDIDTERGDGVYYPEYYDENSSDYENTYHHMHFEDMYERIVMYCEMLRKMYLLTKDKQYWRALIQILPESYIQKRTVTLNYEVLANMYKSRKDHKLDEWHEFCDWIKTLPYSELITGEERL